MTRNILEAVNKAREFFCIEKFPGDFFSHLETVHYMEKYNLLLFKEDLDKLSGFIGYGANNVAVICVNYKRPLGHQNFTLAHEIGHWFLHKGKSLSDGVLVMNPSEYIEKEASEFAKELLYPEELRVKDYYYSIVHDLFMDEKRAELGNFVNELCHKYCLSFELVLRSLLYKNGQGGKYKEVRKQIEKAIGGNISDIYDKDFYVTNPNLVQYQQLRTPYEKMKKYVDFLVEHKKISTATGEAIMNRNRMENK